MVPTQRNKVILALTLVVTAAGVVEGVAGRVWDLAAMFGLLFVLQLVMLLAFQTGRPAVPLRRDLVCWLADRAAATGEPLERLADRCIAAYRAGMTSEPERERSVTQPRIDEAGER